MKKCKYCNKEIEGKHSIYANHVRWCNKNKTNGDKGSEKISEAAIERYKIKSPIVDHLVYCEMCNEKFTLSERESKFKKRKGRYFCSYRCSHKRSENCKKKLSESTKKLWKDDSYAEKIIISNTNRNILFSSKGEREIVKYFKENFPNDGWTSGGGFKYKGLILTRDLYSNKLKTSIEYDGIWHFEDIKGQLEGKQIKDMALERWSVENDWKIVRIKEDVYLENKEYWVDRIVEAVYIKDDKVIKFY